MRRKELQEIKESYRAIAQEIIHSEDAYPVIAGICKTIALEPCYNHHERGQRLWAFFAALEEEGGKLQ